MLLFVLSWENIFVLKKVGKEIAVIKEEDEFLMVFLMRLKPRDTDNVVVLIKQASVELCR